MYQKGMVLKAGNYEDGLYMEDDLLWLNMIAAGAGNLDQICVRFVGAGMLECRGGLRYQNFYRQARHPMLERGQIYMEYAKSVAIQAIVALCPDLQSVYLRQTFF